MHHLMGLSGNLMVIQMFQSPTVRALSSSDRINLYPRGENFLTELPGAVKIDHGSGVALTHEDMNTHIRRGEAVRLGKEWFRVSSEVCCAGSERAHALEYASARPSSLANRTRLWGEASAAVVVAQRVGSRHASLSATGNS